MNDEEMKASNPAAGKVGGNPAPAIETANHFREFQSNQHCPTCDCYDISALGLLEVRTRILLRRLHRKGFKITIPDAVIARLNPQAPRYCFGFTGWKRDATTTRIAGQFLAAIRCDSERGYRYLAVSAISPRQMWLYLPGRPKPDNVFVTEPRAVEYLVGDSLSIHDAPFAEDLLTWGGVTGDLELEAYLLMHLKPLIELATKITAELDAREGKDNG